MIPTQFLNNSYDHKTLIRIFSDYHNELKWKTQSIYHPMRHKYGTSKTFLFKAVPISFKTSVVHLVSGHLLYLKFIF